MKYAKSADNNTNTHERQHRYYAHDHTHGTIATNTLTSDMGIQTVKWSFVALAVTAILQVAAVVLSGSVALLADTIHNLGDAATAVPLWIAFAMGKKKPTRRFTYGYGRVEDLAGVVIVLIILFSAILAGFEAVDRFLHPRSIEYLWAVILASVVGFLGNEGVALFRIRRGKQIGSAALVADGYHARVDGITSLAVLAGAIGVWLGYPWADPFIGLLITAIILRIIMDSGRTVFTRLLDGVDPEVVGEISHAVNHVAGVQDIGEVRVRWSGHRLHAEVNIAVNPELSVDQGHEIAKEVRHQLLQHLHYLSNATIHVDPSHASGEEHHTMIKS